MSSNSGSDETKQFACRKSCRKTASSERRPTRGTCERCGWSAAAALEMRPAGFPWTQFRYAEAITYFARALGAARSGNPSAARGDIEKLTAVYRAMAQVEQGYSWSAQVEVQRL